MFHIDIGSVNIRISVWPFLQRVLPAFVVPWQDITACVRARFYFSPPGLRLQIAHWQQPLHFYSILWRNDALTEAIQNRWHDTQSQVQPCAAGEQLRASR